MLCFLVFFFLLYACEEGFAASLQQTEGTERSAWNKACNLKTSAAPACLPVRMHAVPCLISAFLCVTISERTACLKRIHRSVFLSNLNQFFKSLLMSLLFLLMLVSESMLYLFSYYLSSLSSSLNVLCLNANTTWLDQ